MSAQAKQNIIKKIQQALTNSVPVPFPAITEERPAVFHTSTDDLAIVFAQQFTDLQGQFSFCTAVKEVVQQLMLLSEKRGMKKWFCADASIRTSLEHHGWTLGWHHSLNDCHASITYCEALVARTGTMVLSSEVSGGRTTSIYAPVHVCLASTAQLVYDLSDAFALLENKYQGNIPSQISFASGPSRTADIEKTLVTGVHGPKEVFCFLIEEP